MAHYLPFIKPCCCGGNVGFNSFDHMAMNTTLHDLGGNTQKTNWMVVTDTLISSLLEHKDYISVTPLCGNDPTLHASVKQKSQGGG